MRPYGRHLLICSHGDCADPAEAEALHRRVAELNRLHGRNKLRNPERIKCTLADCLGVCRAGPIVAVYPEGVWYHRVDAHKLERIYHEHVLGGEPIHEWVFHHHYPVGQEPAYAPAARGDERWEDERIPDTEQEAADREAGVLDAPATDASPERTEAADARRRAVRRARKKKGLIILNTGEGKGKTTAALGVMTRAWGRDMRIGVLQFLKNEHARFGEIKAGQRMGIDWISTGDGWTWTSRDGDETEARARRGWQVAQDHIVHGGSDGPYDLLILDEFTYPLHYGWLDTDEVVAWLQEHKPPMLHLIITGRYAPPALVEAADLVTEMRAIKHPFDTQGIRAQPGIEY
jgi:cob(I)alamin adenosyltransferase